MEGTAAYHYLTSAANWVIMNPLERCNPIGLQSPLQQNKSRYRLATRPSANTRRAGHAQLVHCLLPTSVGSGIQCPGQSHHCLTCVAVHGEDLMCFVYGGPVGRALER